MEEASPPASPIIISSDAERREPDKPQSAAEAAAEAASR
jgi:hypothetical protein